ncbi:AraC family ligand binding domain-containing protein [Dubosiella muris]|uniref:AraC family transcriptional regulator n=2 Tax=Dubosiella TaxID=1937008 RepID=A0AC61R5X6_9FIRM|nr:AraC family ligand binding domain-containing protein [Dubosiella muris]TGY65270.1 AraC family transcriptional regulator [Dubosiella muris]
MRITTNSTDFYFNAEAMVYTQGYEECEPGHSYGPAVRKSFMIHYVTQGKGIFKVNGQTYRLSRGDLFFIVPGQEIYYEADKDDPWGYGWIGMTGAHIDIESYLRRTSFFDSPIAHYAQNYDLSLLFIEMQRAYVSPFEIRDLALNHVLYKFLAFLVLHFPNQNKEAKRSSKDYIKEIMTYCLSHVDVPIRVQDVADYTGLHRSYLSRLFKQETNLSLKEYIWKTKEEEACRLLIQTELPIHVIARSVGFEDSLHFTKIFTQKIGSSPKKYRQMKSGPGKEDNDEPA